MIYIERVNVFRERERERERELLCMAVTAIACMIIHCYLS